MRRPRRFSGWLLTLLLAWVVVYTLLIVGAEAARADLGAFFLERTVWSALWASLWISAASVGLAAAIGVPLAFVFERYDFPGRRVLGSLVALPAVMPPSITSSSASSRSSSSTGRAASWRARYAR